MALESHNDRELGSSKAPDNAGDDTGRMTRRNFLAVLGLGALAANTAADTLRDSQKQEQSRQRGLHAHRSTPLPVLDAVSESTNREKLRIVPGLPTFSRLRDLGVYDHPYTFTPPFDKSSHRDLMTDPKERMAMGHDWVSGNDYDCVKWAITASSESLTAIGQQLADTSRTAELLQKEELRILCPAAGVLLSPLEIAFQMLERSDSMQRVHFTCTEIDPDTYRVIDSYLRRTVNACANTANFTVTEEFHPELIPDQGFAGKKKSMQFTYVATSGRQATIAIDFELQMSGDHYFRSESAAQADIFLFHDLDRTSHVGDFPQTKSAGDVYTLLTDTPTRGLADKPHYCIISQNTCSSHHDAPNYAVEGIGTVIASSTGKPFGCGQNHLDHNNPLAMGDLNTTVANIVELDSGLMMYLHTHGGDALWRAYTLLLNPDALQQAFWGDNNEGNVRLMMQNFIEKVRTMREPRVKRIIRQAAAKGIAHLSDDRPRRTLLQAILQAAQ